MYKDYAGDIHSSGVHLLNLINEILDLSRIEAGRYELNEEAVSLHRVVEDCHHLLKLRAGNRGITIHELFEPDMPRLWADERAVRQICLNLLSNAIKFTPQGGEIWLKVGWTASGGQYMSVKDTGPGIPEEEIPVVLASFGQGSNSIKSAEQGAGLGLPIAKNLIDLHGGTFTLKSKLRIGTEVIVTFPPERVMSALAPIGGAPPIQPHADTASRADSPRRGRSRHRQSDVTIRAPPRPVQYLAQGGVHTFGSAQRPVRGIASVRQRLLWALAGWARGRGFVVHRRRVTARERLARCRSATSARWPTRSSLSGLPRLGRADPVPRALRAGAARCASCGWRSRWFWWSATPIASSCTTSPTG